nr:translation initiation factor IF-2-like [Aegilops tauschii subsp. strangulata]
MTIPLSCDTWGSPAPPLLGFPRRRQRLPRAEPPPRRPEPAGAASPYPLPFPFPPFILPYPRAASPSEAAGGPSTALLQLSPASLPPPAAVSVRRWPSVSRGAGGGGHALPRARPSPPRAVMGGGGAPRPASVLPVGGDASGCGGSRHGGAAVGRGAARWRWAWRRPPCPDLGLGPHLGWAGRWLGVRRRRSLVVAWWRRSRAVRASLIGALQHGDRTVRVQVDPAGHSVPGKSLSPRPVGPAEAVEAVPSLRSRCDRSRGRFSHSISRSRVGSSSEAARVAR